MQLFKYLSFFTLSLITLLPLQAQSSINKLDSILYTSPLTEIPGWKSINYDDSDWSLGKGYIGYGDTAYMDNEKDTEIQAIQTLYTRSFFTIDTPDNYQAISLVIDYDDGFVAYINGVEFARVGMGNFDSTITFNQLASRSHECIPSAYDNWPANDFVRPVSAYYIDKAFIDSVFVIGNNVLAIEVHNDSVDGSDLMYSAKLIDRTNEEYSIYIDADRHIRSIQLDSSFLPIIKINTNELGIPSKRYEVQASIEVINNNRYNRLNDESIEHSGNIFIEIRGESSSTFPKRSYNIELQDAEWNDTSVSLLGMPRESDWILQGSFADKSLIRNALIYDMGRKTGNWSPRIKFCEVIFNGEFIGLYNLTERIKRNSNRLDIAKLRTSEISGNDLTGGYILKYDKPASSLQIVYPKEHNLQPEQDRYIRDFVLEYKNNLHSNQGLDPINGYKKYIDEQTLVDYMVLAEFGKNCDSYLNSTYFYKDRADRDNRLKVGPVWDFDLCFGNASWQNGDKTDLWQFENKSGISNDKFSIMRMLEDPEFADLFEARWNELRSNFLSNDSINIVIDSLVTYLKPAIDRNYRVWPVIDKGVFFPVYEVASYEEEIQNIKDWVAIRTTWIDNTIGDIYYPVTNYTDIKQSIATNSYNSNVYPNPFIDELVVELELPEAGLLELDLLNIQGKTVSSISNSNVSEGNYKIYWRRNTEELYYGLYFISIKVNGELYEHLKVLHVE